MRILIQIMKKDLLLYLGISVGVFLFILFFQPFPIDRFDFDNRLLFIAGIAAIIYLLMVLVRVISRAFSPGNGLHYEEPEIHSELADFIILALNSAAVVFYLRYVGSVSISFYIVFKVIMICLIPPVALWLYDTLKSLRQRNESLIKEKDLILEKLEEQEEVIYNRSFDFISEGTSEKLSLQIGDVIVIRSADNYVEIFFKEGDSARSRLIRNTLKGIELQLASFPHFIRCHRTALVNKQYIEKLNSKFNNYSLTLSGYDEPVPVSRQYLLRIREAL